MDIYGLRSYNSTSGLMRERICPDVCVYGINAQEFGRKTVMKSWFEKEKLKRVPFMLAAVIMMGVCVSLLKMTSFGPDPCSSMNYGVARLVGLSFGVYQMLLNITVFIIIFFIDRSKLGLGSFGNMILVGYAADLTDLLMKKLFGITEFEGLGVRIAVMLCALTVFVFSAAVYMNCGLGTAPYDAAAFLIYQKLFADKGRRLPFRAVRIVYDGIAALIGVITDGGVGIVTILMIPALGSAVDFVGKGMHQFLRYFSTKKYNDLQD